VIWRTGFRISDHGDPPTARHPGDTTMIQRALVIAACLGIVTWTASARAAGAGDGLGLRGGFAREPGQIVLGGHLELGPALGPAYVVPGLDLHVANGPTFVNVNTDLRWYLLPLPDTGLYLYGAAGPGLVLADDVGTGGSLVVGAHIPMRSGRRYNLEARFGFADLPGLKVSMAYVWDL
jgi:hypothetical protein